MLKQIELVFEHTTNSPPVFLVCGDNDRPGLHQQSTLNHKLQRRSGNGFDLRANDPKPAGKWIERFEEWLADSGFLRKP